MAKDFTLQEGQGVDENLRPVRINGENTSLEVANDGNGAKVKGDLTITGNIPNVNTNTIVSSNLNIESNIIKFGASDSPVFVKTDGHIEFDGCGVGFDLVNPTYDATDTDVDFSTGNKQQVTFGSGNITDLNLIFPKISGNFVLLLKQDGTGSRTVTNYKVWDRIDSSAAAGSATVKFAGGSNPTLTTDANHVDIISIFYDCDAEIAYGVASLDFQF